jgi:hypothetical protein
MSGNLLPTIAPVNESKIESGSIKLRFAKSLSTGTGLYFASKPLRFESGFAFAFNPSFGWTA